MFLESLVAAFLLGALLAGVAVRHVYRQMLNVETARRDLARREAGEWEQRSQLVSALLTAMLRMERRRRDKDAGSAVGVVATARPDLRVMR